MERMELLEKIYDARSGNYPDLKRFKTEKSLLERRKKVLGMLSTQRVGSDRWKRLSIEREFIRIKMILLFKDSPPSIDIIMDKSRLELLDLSGRYEDSDQEKKETSLILLKYTMIKKSNQELIDLLASL